jgi:hypothetical protein
LILIERNWANETGPTFARTGEVAIPNATTIRAKSNSFMAPIIICRLIACITNSLLEKLSAEILVGWGRR